jgi:hypothetical protein
MGEFRYIEFVFRGGDGFAVIKMGGGNPSDLYIYDAVGEEVSLLGLGVVPTDTYRTGWHLTKAMKSGDRLAVSMRCSQIMAPCGFELFLYNVDAQSASGALVLRWDVIG